MIDRKLTMAYVAGRIAESFKTNLFVIWSQNNSEKLIVRFRVLGGGRDDDSLGMVEEDIFLPVRLRGVPGIQRIFLQLHDKDVDNSGAIKLLETDCIKLKNAKLYWERGSIFTPLQLHYFLCSSLLFSRPPSSKHKVNARIATSLI
jgi:hypothetical protein